MIFYNIFGFPLIVNVVLTITLNKNIFLIAEAFIIINFFLTLYNFPYYNI